MALPVLVVPLHQCCAPDATLQEGVNAARPFGAPFTDPLATCLRTSFAHLRCLLSSPSRHTSQHTMQTTSDMTKIQPEAALWASVSNPHPYVADERLFGYTHTLFERRAR